MNGRKRHVAVDSLGLLLGVAVTAANVHDARPPRGMAEQPDTVRDVYADSSYHSHASYGYTGRHQGEV